ncbi:MAG: aminotransferase class III-fold pyridoxal phosphate-dependent enzyme [Chlamydiales bacterium]|nr:aminotransferase class III-fold pyridoxal phosphate-dependent enzyme [Chlamydiales bacterium]
MADRLVADSIYEDPDFQTATRKILNSVARHSDKITGIRPSQSALAISYENIIKAFNSYRGIDLFYPYLGSGAGNGALVELADGSVKYDFISGIGVHFGHSHPAMIAASLEAAVEDIAMQGNLQQNRCSYELTQLLVKASQLPHCFLTTSGAMANENALKIAFQKKAPAHRILAFEHCFMGRTLALSQITDRPAFREGLPHLIPVDYIPYYDWRDPMGSTERALAALNTLLSRHPGKYASMCFELIQGEAGCYPGKHEFFVEIMRKLKENGIAILVDEVQTFGRTENLFAFQTFRLQEYVDIVTVGKLLHLCATLYTSAFRPKPGLIAQTYTASTSSIHGAKAIVNSLLNEGYLGRNGKNMQIRRRIVGHLERIADKYPGHFEGPFGHGLMIAATPFKGNREKVIAYVKALFEAGVIVFIAGSNPTRLRMLVPAGGITNEAIDEVGGLLEEVLVKCL